MCRQNIIISFTNINCQSNYQFRYLYIHVHFIPRCFALRAPILEILGTNITSRLLSFHFGAFHKISCHPHITHNPSSCHQKSPVLYTFHSIFLAAYNGSTNPTVPKSAKSALNKSAGFPAVDRSKSYFCISIIYFAENSCDFSFSPVLYHHFFFFLQATSKPPLDDGMQPEFEQFNNLESIKGSVLLLTLLAILFGEEPGMTKNTKKWQRNLCRKKYNSSYLKQKRRH